MPGELISAIKYVMPQCFGACQPALVVSDCVHGRAELARDIMQDYLSKLARGTQLLHASTGLSGNEVYLLSKSVEFALLFWAAA